MTKLNELNKDLDDVRLGEGILRTRRESIESEIRENSDTMGIDEIRATIIQLNSQPKMKAMGEGITADRLLQANHLDSLEGNNWEDEQENIDRKQEQELILEGD